MAIDFAEVKALLNIAGRDASNQAEDEEEEEKDEEEEEEDFAQHCWHLC